MSIKFKELRPYLSRVVRISVCFQDGHYDNYTLVSDIPDTSVLIHTRPLRFCMKG